MKAIKCVFAFVLILTSVTFAQQDSKFTSRPITSQEDAEETEKRVEPRRISHPKENVISVYTKPADSLINLYLKIISGDYKKDIQEYENDTDFVAIDSAAFFRYNPAQRVAMMDAFSKGSGTVEVRSNIEKGLMIINDSLEYPGTNFPVSLTNMPSGDHIIRVRSELGVIGMTKVNVIDAQKIIANVEIIMPKSNLQVRSRPTASFVYLDGERVGHTPVEVEGLDAGTYKLEIKREGYLTFDTKVEIEHGKAPQVFVPLVAVVPEDIDAPVYAQPKYIAAASFGTAGLIFGILAITNRVSYSNYSSDGQDYEKQLNEAIIAERPRSTTDELYENELKSKLRAEDSRNRSNIFLMLSLISVSFSVPLLVF